MIPPEADDRPGRAGADVGAATDVRAGTAGPATAATYDDVGLVADAGAPSWCCGSTAPRPATP